MAIERQPIATPDAPGAIGPYSQAIRTGNLIFASGQVALDPATGQLVEGDVAAQTHQVFKNLSAVLRAAGSDLSLMVKTTVFLVDMADFAAMNAVYQTYFTGTPPARSTVGIAQLPRPTARVEIECIALVGDD